MIQYGFTADLSALSHLPAIALEKVKPKVSYVVRQTSVRAAEMWKKSVAPARIREAEKVAYEASIRWEMVGEFAALVWTDYAPAAEIETGRPAKDLKAVLATAKKARVVKTGKHAGQKYLIIPFRHNVPTPAGVGAYARQMPPAIYSLAKALAPSGVTGATTRLSATGHTVYQDPYHGGGRLPAGLAPKAKPYHVTDLYAGMVRFDQSTGKAKSSAYMTFRTMGEWSHEWIVPAKPGLFLAQKVSERIGPVFASLLAYAVPSG
ncbi:hypothetical protein [uncultured Thiodictyon sp.]|uniref:hypothetical protein n=1 Tax=uncultured Thiodictyon sp. TaxID=1846217 RepID=UPI0025D8E3DA|nr:hypothetical protein [uncultured Thiodictyon sp.]